MLVHSEDPAAYTSRSGEVFFTFVERALNQLEVEATASELMELHPKSGVAWIPFKICARVCESLFSTCPAWTFEHLNSAVKDYGVRNPWSTERDNLFKTLANFKDTPDGKGYLPAELRDADHIIDLDVALSCIMDFWMRENTELFRQLEEAEQVGSSSNHLVYVYLFSHYTD